MTTMLDLLTLGMLLSCRQLLITYGTATLFLRQQLGSVELTQAWRQQVLDLASDKLHTLHSSTWQYRRHSA
jgi:hypothetical protein